MMVSSIGLGQLEYYCVVVVLCFLEGDVGLVPLSVFLVVLVRVGGGYRHVGYVVYYYDSVYVGSFHSYLYG